jgi:hypothetical protein
VPLQEGARPVDGAGLQLRRILPGKHRDLGVRRQRGDVDGNLGSLFDDSDLFEDFCRALQKQSILRSSEKHSLKKAKPAISLFALTAMHNAALIWAMEAPLRSKSPPTSKAD